jgi:3-isopropylmalate dehydratase small subunit
VDTDAILPAVYLNLSDPQELAKNCMKGIDPEFSQKVRPGDIVVAEENFGCGSSREHAPLSLKAAGVGAVVARSFARIFFRNAFNIGLSIVECPEAVEDILDGDQLQIDVVSGTLQNLDRDNRYSLHPFPPFIQELIAAGGLMNYVMKDKT